MRAVAIINQKGGCGKTTASINLAACLAVRGRRTLLVDMDPQGHCAVGLAVPEEQIEHNIYDVLISDYNDTKVELKHIVWQIAQNLDLCPSGIELAAFEQQMAGQAGREDCLRNVFAKAAQEYSYVIIDCPPSVGLLTFNALRASDEVIIPVETGYFALHGLGRQMETIRVLKDQCHQEIRCRVLANMYDVRTKLAREVLSELKKQYSASLFKMVINFNTKLKEAASFGQPISEYDSGSKGMQDFLSLAEEIIESEQLSGGEDRLQDVTQQLDAISKSANELLAESEALVGTKPQVQVAGDDEAAAEAPVKTLQQKIDNFYGVRTGQGKVQFAGLYPHAKQVELAGDFNDWEPERTPLSRVNGSGRWSVDVPLESGNYRYRYVVDGRWQQDPYNEQAVNNEFGEYNSVVEVK